MAPIPKPASVHAPVVTGVQGPGAPQAQHSSTPVHVPFHADDGFVGSVSTARPPRTPQQWQEEIQGILSRYPYGPAGLQAAEAELNKLGEVGADGVYRRVELQVASDGGYRGRLFLPDGRRIDVCAPDESLDWWHNQTGSGWGWTDRGIDTGGGAAPVTALASIDKGGTGLEEAYLNQVVANGRRQARQDEKA